MATNFAQLAISKVKQVASSLGKAINPQIIDPSPSYQQTYKPSTSDKFWTGPIGQGLANVQNRFTSGELIKPYATDYKKEGLPTTLNKYAANMATGTFNTLYGKGVTAPVSDLTNIFKNTLSSKPLPKYSELSSPQAKLGYELGGLGNKSNSSSTGTKYGFKQIAGNVAGTVEPIITAYAPETAKGVVKDAVKQGFRQVVKEATITGAKFGSVYGLITSLSENKDVQDNIQYLLNVSTTTAASTVLGGILGGGTAAVSNIVGRVFNRIGEINPSATTKQKIIETGKFLKDGFWRSEDGRFAKKEPLFYGDLREELGVPRTGIEKPGSNRGGFADLNADVLGNTKKEPLVGTELPKTAPAELGTSKTSLQSKPENVASSTNSIPPDVLNTIHEAINSGDQEATQAIYKNLSSEYKLPPLEQIKNELETVQNMEIAAATGKSSSEFGDYGKVVQKFKSFLTIAAEKKSKTTNELFREHIPQSVAGVPSDVVASDLGMSESELMSKIMKDVNVIASGKGSSNTISDFAANVKKAGNKVPKPIKDLYDSLPENFKVTRTSLGKVEAVSAEPSLKTKQKVQLRDAQIKTVAQQKEYKTWQKQVFGEAETRTTNKAIDDLAKSMKTSTNEAAAGMNTADNWKDKPRISYARETMERNFEDIMGKDAPEMKQKILEPIYKAEADRTKFLNKERADIQKLGIAPRSKDSALVQQFGEGKITPEQLKTMSPNSEKIVKAESVLRQKYDSYLEQLNKVLTRNGYDPIPKRQDYFHHFQDLEGLFGQVGVSIKATDLPTDINGLSADFKPGKNFFNAALQRKGDQTSVDAITGIDKYLEGASKQIYHTDNIQRLRAFESAIREKYAGTTHLSNFAADLTEYTNKIAGKKAMVDRAVESMFGRKVYAGANALKKQVGANMVGANVSSALTNFIPVTETLATTDKVSVLQAMLNIFKNTFKDDGFVDSSNFLTSRVGSDRLALTKWEKVSQMGNWLFGTIDSFTSQLAVRSKYLEGIKKGLSEEAAMKAADSWGRKTLAGRSVGEMPTLFNSSMTGFLTQFQLEVNNQMSFMAKDIPRNFNKVGAASALGQLFVYSYIYNNLYEKITGRRPAIDPIGLAQQSYEDYTNPNMKSGQATKNLVKNVSETLPFTSILTGGRIPIGGAIPNPIAVATGDSTVGKEASKLAYLLPPTGGGQLKKTIEGLGAFKKGASTTEGGNVRYPIPQTTGNLAKTALFGQYSTPEAQTYFREGRNVLGAKQSEGLLQSPDKQGFYDKIIQKRQEDKQLKSKPGQSVGGKISYQADDGSIKVIDVGKVATMPEATSYESLQKKKAAYALADDVLKLPINQQAEAFNALGITADDATYYQAAKGTNDLKRAFINDDIQNLDSSNRANLVNYLISQRKEINGDMVLSNGIVDDLYEENMISEAEKNMLKNLKIIDGKPVTKLTGRGKKTALKKVSLSTTSSKIKPTSMKALLAKTKKLKVKKYKFRKKL